MNRMLQAGGLAALLTLGFASSASALDGYVTVDLNLRAGPNTDYPAVTVIPAGTPIFVHGCLEGYGWCDVSYGDYRGWSYGEYLDVVSGGDRVYIVEAAPPIITFSFVDYWDRYYVGRPFYRERDRYRELRAEIRQIRRQERREDRQERREDRQEDRRERVEDRQDNQQEQRQERRQEQRQDQRQERTQEQRQERRQEQRQERRQDQQQERRNNRRNQEECPEGQVCQ